MRLKCVARYRSSLGTFEAGQIIDGNDDMLGVLLRDSPGSFKVDGITAPAPEPEAPDLSAISEETATGLTVPDRRMRGGRRR